MDENIKYQPEYNLLQDAYLGSREVLQKKLLFLSNMAQPEKWDYCCEHSEMTRYYFHELSQDFSVCWQMTYFDFKSPDYVA